MRLASHIKRVAITGANGFTGLALTSALRTKGHTVFGFGRGQDPSWGMDGDLTDRAGLKKFFASFLPDAVIHLAGIASPIHGSVTEVYDANVIGTANLLEALASAHQQPQITIVASSATVYAESPDSSPIAECSNLEPRTHYANSKLAVEKMCGMFSNEINIRVVRPFNYTGPGQATTFLVPKIVSHFVNDTQLIELGNVSLERDISDLRDVVECYCRLVSCSAGPPVNMCSGETVKLLTIIDMLSQISGRSMTVRTNPHLVRPNEAYRIWGDRSELDRLIGTWSRHPTYDTLSWMYHMAIK